MSAYFQDFQNIMTSFLGEPKNNITDNGQLQFPCPRCVAEKGSKEIKKYNLEVNIFKGFQCWSCCSFDDEMKGSISKLIKQYGNDEILKQYRDLIIAMKNEPLYTLHFKHTMEPLLKEETLLPKNFKLLLIDSNPPIPVMNYINKRGITWEIIKNFNMGYTTYDANNKQVSSRIIIPSYNEYGELNYWTGRDFTLLPNRQKYFNPKVERKDLIFNEDKIQWDADITLVEGPFDHIVVPNSIPLLGKALTPEYKIYQSLMNKANANVNIFLDGDAYNSALKIYKTLNQGKLRDRIRYIPTSGEEDPSDLFAKHGNNAILSRLSNATKISELKLQLLH